MVNQLESAFDISAEADKAVSDGGLLFSPWLNACDQSDHDDSRGTARPDTLWELSQPQSRDRDWQATQWDS